MHLVTARVSRLRPRSRDAAVSSVRIGSVRLHDALIVAAIRRLTVAYNAGANHVVLSVVEQSGQPTVTVAAGGEGAPCLTATLENTLLCMRARDALGIPHANQFRLRAKRASGAG